MASAAVLQTRLYEAFGTGRSAEDRSAELLTLRRLGGGNADEYAEQLPKMLLAARGQHISESELLGITATASQFGGSDKKVVGGLNELFDRGFENAAKEGINLVGSATEKIAQLGEVARDNPALLAKILPENGATIVALLNQQMGQLRGNIDAIGTSKGAEVLLAISKQFSDPQGAAAQA